MKSPVKYALVVLLIAAVAAGTLLWSMLAHGFSARDTPTSAEAFIATRLRHLAVPRAALEAKNPVEQTPDVLAGAMEHFSDHCATCHGNDGSGNTLIGRGLYPKPPDMAQPGTQQLSDGELYYIIENGIRFTGMPAFGETAGDEQDKESWALVHFIRHLPAITPEELIEMKKMNPKSPMELEKEEQERKFLQGDDSPQPAGGHEHHH